MNQIRFSRSTAGVLAALAMGLGGAGSGWAASDKADVADEPAPFSSIPADVRDKMQAQLPLSRAAGRLMKAVDAQSPRGFAGIALEAQQVVLWWHGAPPRSMAKVLAEARRIAPVVVRPALHSRAELRQAAESIARKMRADRASPIHMVDVAIDGSGLHVSTEGDVAEATAFLPETAVPVRVEVRSRVTLASRYHDTAPYWGGAAILNHDNGARCTSGFGVTSQGQSYLLTAGHCGRAGGGWWNGDRTLWIGTASAEHVAHDLMLIPAYAGGRIYDGGVGSGEFSKGVANWNWPFSGEWVCQSGSTSGAVCGIQNSSNFTYSFCYTDMYGNYECLNDLILSRRPDNGIATRPGDSGGPVFSLWGSQVTAKGTVTGYASDANCFACYLLYQDFGTAWRDFGVVPLTSY